MVTTGSEDNVPPCVIDPLVTAKDVGPNPLAASEIVSPGFTGVKVTPGIRFGGPTKVALVSRCLPYTYGLPLAEDTNTKKESDNACDATLMVLLVALGVICSTWYLQRRERRRARESQTIAMAEG